MQRVPVESSDIVSIGYDHVSKVLEIEFHGGRVYQYRNVDPDIYGQLMRADSHGQFFNTFIHGRFRFDRVDAVLAQQSAALAFVTGNARKFRDMQQVFAAFDMPLEQLVLPVDEIQSQDIEDVAVKKAKAAYRLAKRPVVVQDTFWSILALHGFPGAYMADMVQWLKADDFLRLMQDKSDRTIVCTDALVYFDGTRSKLFKQDFMGTVAAEPRGEGYVSIDRLVILQGNSQTIAEIEDAGHGSSIDPATTHWQAFAKWYNLQRKLKRA